MADITSGRTRRILSVGRLTTAVGGSYLWQAHQVFLMRALLGLDAYLKAFGTVRNWHRLFAEIVEALPE